MSEWHELSEIHAEETEFPVAATVNGADIVIFKNAESYYGVQRYCPHQDADFVSRSAIMGNGKMLRCTLHGFVFKLDTGKGVNAGQHCLDIYEIKREGSQLQARKK
jgi:nitrite reductase/ring-hydroxylating ferredoxin subunit